METITLQQNLFTLIKSKINNEKFLAKTIAENLNINIDSAYKKIKGERLINLTELNLLTTLYKIHLGDIGTATNTEKVWFNFKPIGYNGFTYKQYLQQMVDSLQMLINNKVKYIVYSAKEVPMFYNFMFPELGCFKSFVWQKSILNLDEFIEEKFSIHNLDSEIIELGNQIYNLYNQIHSKEIWNYETVNCTTRQINYFNAVHKFADEESYHTIVEQYNTMLSHIEAQTNAGKKINYKTQLPDVKFDLYHNELLIGDNTVLLQFENFQQVFITPNAVNSLHTSQSEFTSYVSKNINSILSKSSQLNKQNEKYRTQFFDMLRNASAV